MQFIYDGEYYKVIRVSGPSHNLLALSFGDSRNDSQLDIEVLQIDDKKETTILKNNVREQVLLGINEFNKDFGTDYKVKKIQFITSDTPSGTIYKDLAKELVKQIEDKGEFKSV